MLRRVFVASFNARADFQFCIFTISNVNEWTSLPEPVGCRLLIFQPLASNVIPRRVIFRQRVVGENVEELRRALSAAIALAKCALDSATFGRVHNFG